MDRHAHSSSKNYLIVKNKTLFQERGSYCILKNEEVNTSIPISPHSDQGGEL